MCFFVYVLYMLWLLERHLFLFPPSLNVNDPDSASTFSPTVPELVSQKEKRERCCSCLYVRVLSEPVGLCSPPPEPQPLSQTALPRQSHQLPLAFSCGCGGPQGGLQPGYGAPDRGPHCLHQHTFGCKPRALSKLIVSALTASLQKGLNACSLIIWILVNWINC